MKCRVGLGSRHEILLNATVNLLAAALKPEPTSPLEMLGFRQFHPTQNISEKMPRDQFTAWRAG